MIDARQDDMTKVRGILGDRLKGRSGAVGGEFIYCRPLDFIHADI